MIWNDGYTARYHLHRVNRDTWENADELDGVLSVSIERDGTGDAPMLESGSAEVLADVGAEFGEGYYRVSMDAMSGAERQHVDIATLYFRSSSGTTDYGVCELQIDCKSVLFPADERKLIRGEYAQKGVDGAQYAAELLRACVHAPVTVATAFTLDEHIVFDIGDSYLEAAWRVLKAGGCIIQINGRGEISIVKKPTTPALVLDSVNASLLMPTVKPSIDYDGIPNRYTAIDEFETVTIENNDRNSVTSIPARGYVKDEVDESPARVDGETLTAYARRKLREMSTVDDMRVYDREYYPDVYPYSIVRGNLPNVGIDGDLVVRSQSLKIEHGIKVTEKAAREVVTWEG